MKAKTTGVYITIAAMAVIATALCISKSLAVHAVYPVEKAKRTFIDRVWSRVKGAFNAAAASAENVRLKREIESLSLARSEVERLEEEIASLRRELEFKSRSPMMWQAASVLAVGGGAASAWDSIRVDKGASSGVKVGAVVAVANGLVGKVVSVTDLTSEIRLLTDRSVKVSCEVCGADGATVRGILEGGTTDQLVLNFHRRIAEIPLPARVYTSGLGGVFPRGIEVGTLLGVREDAEGLSSEGEVQPGVDFSSLEAVFIRRE